MFARADQSHVAPKDARPLTTLLIMPVVPTLLNISSTWFTVKAGVKSDVLLERRPAFGFLSAPNQAQR